MFSLLNGTSCPTTTNTRFVHHDNDYDNYDHDHDHDVLFIFHDLDQFIDEITRGYMCLYHL